MTDSSPLPRMLVYLRDEAPQIGSGWRIVTYVVGRKWVRIASQGHRGKLPLAAWAVIARLGRELPVRRKRRRKMRTTYRPEARSFLGQNLSPRDEEGAI